MTETSRETLQDPNAQDDGTTETPQYADARGTEARPDDVRVADAPYDELHTDPRPDDPRRGDAATGAASDGDALGSGTASSDDGERLSTADLVDRGNHARDETGADGARAADGDSDEEPTEPLISDGDAYLSRWQTVQAGFVDDPRSAVQDADALVAEVIQRIAESFARERDQLEQQWSGGSDVGTEDLRVQLQRYRSFFTRLLHT